MCLNVCKSYNMCISHHLAPCMHLHPIWYPRTGNTSVEVVRKQKRYQSTRKQKVSFSTVGILVVFSFCHHFYSTFLGSQRFLLGKNLCWMISGGEGTGWLWNEGLWFAEDGFLDTCSFTFFTVVLSECIGQWFSRGVTEHHFLGIQRIRERENFWWKQPLGRLCMVVSWNQDFFLGSFPRNPS